MPRMTDTPYDMAMTRTKEELARQLVEANAEIERLSALAQRQRDPSLDAQHDAQLEGLATGLLQRGEKSAAHIIRLAIDRFRRLCLSQDIAKLMDKYEVKPPPPKFWIELERMLAPAFNSPHLTPDQK